MKCEHHEVPGPCVKCGADEVCAPINEQPHCLDCWHAAREATPCFWLRDAKRDDYAFYLGREPPTGHTLDEAERRVKDFPAGQYRIVPGDWAHSGRIAHPGYMNRRRSAVLAAHPEYR